MNHNVGEVSYDIRFARQKASQDIAAIEAEANAAAARINSKFSLGAGGGGGGAPAMAASGGYAGQSAGNGQPMQGSPPSAPSSSPVAAALNGNSRHWAARYANHPNVTIRDLTGNIIASNSGQTNNSGTYNGQPMQSGRQFFGSGMGNPSLANAGDAYGLSALDAAIPRQMKQTQDALRRDAKDANALDRDNARRARIEERQRLRDEKIMRGESAAIDANEEAAAARRVGEQTADQVPTGLPSTLTHAPGKKTQLSPLAKRALKFVGAAAIAQTITNVMGAVEESLNETLAAGSDPIKQRMAQRNIGRNLVGAVPLIGGSLQNVFDFAGGGANNRADMLAMMARERNAAQRVMGVGTESMLMRASGLRGTAHVGRTFESFAGEKESVASLEEEKRQALLKDPPNRFTGTRQAFDARIDATRKMSQAERARSNFDIEREIYDQQQSNQRMRFEAELRPVKGAAFEIADVAADRFRLSTSFNNRQRPKGLTVFGDKRPLTQEEGDLNDSIDRANQLEKERARGSLQQLNVMRTDALRNIIAGRPQEIGGMQSIEAMRDISPESNEMKLNALNEAIDRLTGAINNMQKGVP